jgi:2-hydroxymethylglutarate dehydrogenase
MSIRNISIIGLGSMGAPIAAFLLKAGYPLKGFDIVKKQMSDLTHFGLKPTHSLKAAATDADLIVLSLPNWSIVREVIEGKDGILTSLKRGQIIADTTTVPPWETVAMGKRLAKRGVEWMNLPVSGSAVEAREGNLLFMAGGKKSVFKKVKPVFDQVGRKTIYIGDHGKAAMLKLIVNHILFINQAAAVEGFTVGLKAGIDPDTMLDVVTSGAANSNLIAARGRDMVQGNFSRKGALEIAVKDIGIIVENGKQLGVTIPMAALYQQLLLSAYHRGWHQKDATVVMKIYEELSGIKR